MADAPPAAERPVSAACPDEALDIAAYLAWLERVNSRAQALGQAVAALPRVRDRLARGDQFNAYSVGSPDEDEDEDEDQEMRIGLGPITDCVWIIDVVGRSRAELIANALTLATLTFPIDATSESRDAR